MRAATGIALVVGLVAGLGLGYLLWPKLFQPFDREPSVSVRTLENEADGLRSENAQLRDRVKSLTAEQERLAQQNDILRHAQEMESLREGKTPALPSLPPK